MRLPLDAFHANVLLMQQSTNANTGNVAALSLVPKGLTHVVVIAESQRIRHWLVCEL